MRRRRVFALPVVLSILLLSCGGSSDSGVKAGESCGGGSATECGVSLFCMFPEAHCGELDSLGSCSEVPEACIEIFQPVCGCDGKTYANSCQAAANRQSIRSQGECESK